MPIVICLLRGVNVGGKHKIRMELFRELLEGLGAEGVKTYVQSGNAVMRVKNAKGLAGRIEGAIEERLGFRPSAVLRTLEEMREVTQRSPFAGRGLPGNWATVTFFAEAPSKEGEAKSLALAAGCPEEIHYRGREHYVYFMNGIGTTQLPLAKMERALGMQGTTRNWNTVDALLEMAEALAKERA